MKKYIKIIIISVSVILFLLICFYVYFKLTYIDKNELENIIKKSINDGNNEIFFESIDLELDKNYYEVDIYYNNREYEYKIDAKNGKIIYTNFKKENNVDNNLQNNNDNTDTNINNLEASISIDEAKNIALNFVGIDKNNVNFIKNETEYEHGILIYEIEFVYDKIEYEFKINAQTGEIISYNKESIYN